MLYYFSQKSLYFLQKVEVFLRESRGVFFSGSLKRVETDQWKGE
jgi:hypothetical protein